MNESPHSLDPLLRDWAASRAASAEHASRLADRILAAAELPEAADAGRSKSGAFSHEPAVTRAARRQASFRPGGTDAEAARHLMWRGGGVLLLLSLAGSLWYFNRMTMAPETLPDTRSISAAHFGSPPTAAAGELPASAALGTDVLAAKRRLLTETNALFDNRLAWIADGEREVSLGVSDEPVSDNGAYLLVRVVVAQRMSPDSPWSTVWYTDVISRNEELVEVTPKQLDGSALALWAYATLDGEVVIAMDLTLDRGSPTQSSSTTVLQAGRPTRVSCSTADGVEQCVFQTVMPLNPSAI